MAQQIALFEAVVLTALALVPGGAHMLELTNKMKLGQRDYFVVQSIYRGWAWVGAMVTAAFAANVWAAAAQAAQASDRGNGSMYYLAAKAIISGILIAAASEMAKRYPGTGALIASLPLVSVLGMIWLWHDKPDAENMAVHAGATFWYVLPSLPMFLLIPVLLRHGTPFWVALGAGCALTILLYSATIWTARQYGFPL